MHLIWNPCATSQIRTLSIIDALESGYRGPYSGSVGFISVGGQFDLNIVIRTAVFSQDGVMEIGAGGAIVALSDPEEEYEEMQLKARALIRTAATCVGSSCSSS